MHEHVGLGSEEVLDSTMVFMAIHALGKISQFRQVFSKRGRPLKDIKIVKDIVMHIVNIRCSFIYISFVKRTARSPVLLEMCFLTGSGSRLCGRSARCGARTYLGEPQ